MADSNSSYYLIWKFLLIEIHIWGSIYAIIDYELCDFPYALESFIDADMEKYGEDSNIITNYIINCIQNADSFDSVDLPIFAQLISFFFNFSV